MLVTSRDRVDTRAGRPIDLEIIEGIVKGLADRFGGATAYSREPAEGLWKRAMSIERDRIIIVEVLVDEVDEGWWGTIGTRSRGNSNNIVCSFALRRAG
jgi:hypothetical protein